MLFLEMAEAVSTFMMTGLCLYVQTAVYPIFKHVGAGEFIAFERAYTARAGIVIAPLMLCELGCALLVATGGGSTRSEDIFPTWLSLALLGIIWTATFLVNVPQHNRLERGFDSAVHRDLVRSGWIRTVAWCVRSWLMATALL